MPPYEIWVMPKNYSLYYRRNGTPDAIAAGCNVSADALGLPRSFKPRYPASIPGPSAASVEVYADARTGSDSNTGTISSPVATLARAVALA